MNKNHQRKMHSKGISWIDDCRIPFVDDGDGDGVNRIRNNVKEQTIYGGGKGFPPIKVDYIKQGRFPANILVSDDMLNDGSITQGTKTKVLQEKNIGYEGWGLNKKKLVEKSDKGTNSRYYDIDKWFDKILNYE